MKLIFVVEPLEGHPLYQLRHVQARPVGAGVSDDLISASIYHVMIGMRLQYLTHQTSCYRITRNHLCILIPDSIHFMMAPVISLTQELDLIKFVFQKACFLLVSLTLLNQIWGDIPIDSFLGEPSKCCLHLGHFVTPH